MPMQTKSVRMMSLQAKELVHVETSNRSHACWEVRSVGEPDSPSFDPRLTIICARSCQ
jgi:hypothetical protein